MRSSSNILLPLAWVILILTLASGIGCSDKPKQMTVAEREELESFARYCSKKCAPRAVGQLANFWGQRMCGCDVVYVNKGASNGE